MTANYSLDKKYLTAEDGTKYLAVYNGEGGLDLYDTKRIVKRKDFEDDTDYAIGKYNTAEKFEKLIGKYKALVEGEVGHDEDMVYVSFKDGSELRISNYIDLSFIPPMSDYPYSSKQYVFCEGFTEYLFMKEEEIEADNERERKLIRSYIALARLLSRHFELTAI
ncbi:hypothetical protein [Persicobacter psychrovividus]|uniref:Uncharacterized protein n=1 Tax=Persicobacter psychrovividus TaxID=387638 RepID=A0ABM7VC89_9BACT|nr:hypothetical protein PEPS_08300 [Persicobacter psychrovividus]